MEEQAPKVTNQQTQFRFSDLTAFESDRSQFLSGQAQGPSEGSRSLAQYLWSANSKSQITSLAGMSQSNLSPKDVEI